MIISNVWKNILFVCWKIAEENNSTTYVCVHVCVFVRLDQQATVS